MKWTTTIVLAVVAAIMAAFFVIQWKDITEGPEKSREGRALVIAPAELNNVVMIEIVREKGETVVCERNLDDKGPRWLIVLPQAMRGGNEIDTLVGAAKEIMIKTTIKQEEGKALDLAQYGLDKPRLKVVYHVLGKEIALLFGNDSKINAAAIYVKRGDKDDVYIADKTTFEQVDKKSVDLRDKLVLEFETYRIERILLSTKNVRAKTGEEYYETAELVKKDDDKWEMESPYKEPVDETQVTRFIQDARNFYAEDFILAPIGLKEYGLETPLLKIALYEKGKKEPREIHFGDLLPSSAKKRYIRNPAFSEVAVIPTERYESLPKDADDFRSRTIFPFKMDDLIRCKIALADGEIVLEKEKKEIVGKDGKKGEAVEWIVKSPEGLRVRKNGVGQFLEAVLSIRIALFGEKDPQNPAMYGLNEPKVKLSLTTQKIEKDKEGKEATTESVHNYFFSRPAKTGEGYVQVGERKQVCGIGKEEYEFLEAAHLNFLDDVVFDIPRNGIKEFAVEILERIVGAPPIKGGYLCRKDEKEEWVLAEPETLRGKEIDKDRLNNILTNINHIRARRFVSRNPADEEEFLLKDYYMKLTITYEEKVGETVAIKKSVLLFSPRINLLHTAKKSDSPLIFTVGADLVEILKEGVERPPPIDKLLPQDNKLEEQRKH